MDWPNQSAASMDAFYGKPDRDGNGVPDRAWEDQNLIALVPPWRMVLAWDTAVRLRSIRVHKKAAESLGRVLARVWEAYDRDQAKVDRARMHLYGGCYMFRLVRGGHSLSIHSWGAAIDLDPERNGLGVPYDESKGMMPQTVVQCFMGEGWTWGGRWGRPDAMHFQQPKVS